MADKDKSYGHTDVAPADGGVVNVNDKGERVAHEDGKGEGLHPIVANPDQPTFPRPFGVSDEDLREAGVGHAYQGVGSDEQVEAAQGDRAAEVEEDGARPATEPEGDPADPEAEAKEKALAEQAKEKQHHARGQHAQTQQKQ